MSKRSIRTQDDIRPEKDSILQEVEEEEIRQQLLKNLGVEVQSRLPEKAKNKTPVSVTVFQGLKPLIEALKSSKINGPVLRALLLDGMLRAGLMPTIYKTAVKKELEDAAQLIVKFRASTKFQNAIAACLNLLDEYE
ncbi:MAG: hypothetical protein ACFFDI_16290 [Promethearchaeota archaeon]